MELPTKAEQKAAKKSLESFFDISESLDKRKKTISIEVNDNEDQRIEVPAKVFDMLKFILSNIAEGKAFSIIPLESELSTQQAADMLNVSRPFLVKQLEAGAIPFTKVGKHRRVLLQHLLEYKEQMEATREQALLNLSREAQELNLGY